MGSRRRCGYSNGESTRGARVEQPQELPARPRVGRRLDCCDNTRAPRRIRCQSRLAALVVYPGELVIKPAVSVGAIGALRAGSSSPEAATHLAELASAGDVLVQPLARSVLDGGESSLIYFGGQFSHAIRKIPADGDYRVQEHHGGSVVRHEPTDDEFAVAAATLAAAPAATAYARVDLVDVDGSPASWNSKPSSPNCSSTAIRMRQHDSPRISPR